MTTTTWSSYRYSLGRSVGALVIRRLQVSSEALLLVDVIPVLDFNGLGSFTFIAKLQLAETNFSILARRRAVDVVRPAAGRHTFRVLSGY